MTPTLVFLLGETHEQRSLMGYSPRGHKELDTTECACMNTGLQCRQGPRGPRVETEANCEFGEKNQPGQIHSCRVAPG